MRLRINLFILFFCFSQIALAADEKREVYQNTYCYRFLTNVVPITYFMVSAVNYLTDEKKELAILDAVNMAGSYFIFSKCINPVVNKLVQCIPPLVSGGVTNEEESIVSCIKKETAGFFLGVQDLLVRAVCGEVIDTLGVKFPVSAATSDDNMDTWCKLYRNPKNYTCDDISEKFFKTEKCSNIGVNFVFIPKTDLRGTDAQYITPENTHDHINRIILPIKDWTKKCETCSVNFWFDHHYSDEKMVANTKRLICEQFDDNKADLKRVYFFDLRNVPLFNAYKKVFDPSIYVYAQADLARFLPDMKDKFFVYTDLDIEALSENQILSAENLDVLKEFPLAFVSAPQGKAKLGFENGFFIMARAKKERDEQILKSFFRACALRLSSYIDDKIPLHEDIIYEMIPTHCVANKMGEMISHKLDFFSDADWPYAISSSSLEYGHLPNIFPKSIRDLASHIDISDEKNHDRFHNFVSAYSRKPLVNLFNNIMNMGNVDKESLEEMVKIVWYFCHLKAEKGFSCCNTIVITSSLLKPRKF